MKLNKADKRGIQVNTNLPKKVEIWDVTLRDGFQHEEMFVPTEAKLWIAERLIEAGFKKIEVGTFSHINTFLSSRIYLNCSRGCQRTTK